MSPPCGSFVPGYGDANADFHVIGDHPGVHGGTESGVPFTNEVGRTLQEALFEAGIVDAPGVRPTLTQTFFSYLHFCVADGTPTAASYTDLERFFDAELRAIAAHVLLPVGERPTRHVLETFTPRSFATTSMSELHATEIRGSGFLVYPIREPAAWSTEDRTTLITALESLQQNQYEQQADLGRFLPTETAYHVR